MQETKEEIQTCPYSEVVPRTYIEKYPILLRIFKGYEKSSASIQRSTKVIDWIEVKMIIKKQKAVKECTPSSFTSGVIFICAWKGRYEDVEYMLEVTPYLKNTVRYYTDVIYAFKNRTISSTNYSLSRLEWIAYFAGRGGNLAVIDNLCTEHSNLLKFALEGASEATDRNVYRRLRKRCLTNQGMLGELEASSYSLVFGLVGLGLGLSTQLFF